MAHAQLGHGRRGAGLALPSRVPRPAEAARHRHRLVGRVFRPRLTLNPAVLTYQAHSTVPIFNWYLYTYSIAATAMFLGAWWLREPHHKVAEINVRGVLWTFGGVLLFWLLNIEIADCFTPTGEEFTMIDFSGKNLSRDTKPTASHGGCSHLRCSVSDSG